MKFDLSNDALKLLHLAKKAENGLSEEEMPEELRQARHELEHLKLVVMHQPGYEPARMRVTGIGRGIETVESKEHKSEKK